MTQSQNSGFGTQGQNPALFLLAVVTVTDHHQQTAIKSGQFENARISRFRPAGVLLIFQRIILLIGCSPAVSISGIK
ncbi:TPA: hypothetical protein MIO20_10245 [Klebsiella variicola]|nr:hypothetical protein [Klebsiella variicola]